MDASCVINGSLSKCLQGRMISGGVAVGLERGEREATERRLSLEVTSKTAEKLGKDGGRETGGNGQEGSRKREKMSITV